ncbi:hypothetical protein CBR_g3047 [Chara braunii]|uniref:Uncharacterized protein n=1 Tax=Chara braunii TaxID=69332 RepID=A0A388KEX9_CHABU|nr:hypothetical protein CBR_g3047 [Chara braunii]|eukprot:GBG68503.1 hypothetical protein CBR_g3047 [Chara braunii]
MSSNCCVSSEKKSVNDIWAALKESARQQLLRSPTPGCTTAVIEPEKKNRQLNRNWNELCILDNESKKNRGRPTSTQQQRSRPEKDRLSSIKQLLGDGHSRTLVRSNTSHCLVPATNESHLVSGTSKSCNAAPAISKSPNLDPAITKAAVLSTRVDDAESNQSVNQTSRRQDDREEKLGKKEEDEGEEQKTEKQTTTGQDDKQKLQLQEDQNVERARKITQEREEEEEEEDSEDEAEKENQCEVDRSRFTGDSGDEFQDVDYQKLLQAVHRDVNCLSDPRIEQRFSALKRLNRCLLPRRGVLVLSSGDRVKGDEVEDKKAIFGHGKVKRAVTGNEGNRDPPNEVVSVIVYNHVLKPLLRRFDDVAERCREMAVSTVLDLLMVVPEAVLCLLAYVVSAMSERLQMVVPPGYQIGGEGDDESDCCDRSLLVIGATPVESSEEIRLLLVRMVRMLMHKAGEPDTIARYGSEIASMLVASQMDNHPEVLAEGAKGLEELARLIGTSLRSVSKVLVEALLPALCHKRFRVRIASIRAVQVLVPLGAADSILKLVGWKDPNLVPIKAFYEVQVRTQYFACLAKDDNVSVREAFLRMVGDWMVNMPEHSDHEVRLLPYVLCAFHDPSPKLQQLAFNLMESIGEQYELDHKDELKETKYYMLEDVAMDFFDSASPPPPPPHDHLSSSSSSSAAASFGGPASRLLRKPPFARRPRLGARRKVKGTLTYLQHPILAELNDWTGNTRCHAVQLLQTLLIYSEDSVTMHLHPFLLAFCKLCQDDLIQEHVVDCSAIIGYFVDPSVYVPVLLPRLSVQHVYHSVASSISGVIKLLASLIAGSRSKGTNHIMRMKPHVVQILSSLVDSELLDNKDSQLKRESLALARELLYAWPWRSTSTESSGPTTSALAPASCPLSSSSFSCGSSSLSQHEYAMIDDDNVATMLWLLLHLRASGTGSGSESVLHEAVDECLVIFSQINGFSDVSSLIERYVDRIVTWIPPPRQWTRLSTSVNIDILCFLLHQHEFWRRGGHQGRNSRLTYRDDTSHYDDSQLAAGHADVAGTKLVALLASTMDSSSSVCDSFKCRLLEHLLLPARQVPVQLADLVASQRIDEDIGSGASVVSVTLPYTDEKKCMEDLSKDDRIQVVVDHRWIVALLTDVVVPSVSPGSDTRLAALKVFVTMTEAITGAVPSITVTVVRARGVGKYLSHMLTASTAPPQDESQECGFFSKVNTPLDMLPFGAMATTETVVESGAVMADFSAKGRTADPSLQLRLREGFVHDLLKILDDDNDAKCREQACRAVLAILTLSDGASLLLEASVQPDVLLETVGRKLHDSSNAVRGSACELMLKILKDIRVAASEKTQAERKTRGNGAMSSDREHGGKRAPQPWKGEEEVEDKEEEEGEKAAAAPEDEDTLRLSLSAVQKVVSLCETLVNEKEMEITSLSSDEPSSHLLFSIRRLLAMAKRSLTDFSTGTSGP